MPIGVSPQKLEFDLSIQGTQSLQIFVQNLGNNSVALQAKAVDQLHRITVDPENFSLEPSQTLPISVTVQGTTKFQSEIAITANGLTADNLQIQSGIKIPLIVSESGHISLGTNLFWPIGLALVLAIAVYLFIQAKQTKPIR